MFYNALHNRWFKMIIMMLGSAMAAVAVNLFIVPLGLYNGGLLGISQMLRTFMVDSLGMSFGTTDVAGIIYYLMNVPLFLYCIKALGLRVVTNSIICTTVYSLAYSLVPVPTTPIIEDMLMSCLLGGMLAGIGCGLYLTCGGSGGGLDLIAMVLAKKGINVSVGQFCFGVNIFIYTLCLILFSPTVAIYSVVYNFFTSMALDRYHQQNVTVQALVFTRGDHKALSGYIIEKLHRSVTYWDGVGAYTEEGMHVLCVCLSKYEIEEFDRVVKKADAHAFTIVHERVRILGNFAKRLD